MLGYAEIATHFRRQIADGELNPGDEMPSYNKAAEQFGVNRTTVIRAYDLLKTEGLIVSRSGVGTVVAARPAVVISGVDRLDRLHRTGRRYGAGEDSTGHRVMRRSVVDGRVCQALDVEPGEEVVIRIRTFRQDGRPTSVGVSVYPPRTVAEVPELAEEERMERYFGDIYTERTGREVTKGQRTAHARQASQDEIDALQLDVPAHMAVAVLVTNVTFHDDKGPLGYWEDVYAPGEQIPVS
ncbi:GntR family transcriptional regulator [Streptomyces cyanogenus]|uniref:HTH-type transcriptional repressor YvoA n=1 Tax=Streptomyces cyanogenus TaxID=80860 RepID=A0ABX7TNI8_STRCY|nr:GntR family transcriptional regulator [Streptomyces cyanogenus]QTD97006.1 HTH-type transcriptional repressor YvoA [Streptomyces cyanogenus]